MTLPLPPATAVAVFITIWWITLFAILPIGVRSAHEDAETMVSGSDPGAPLAPRLLFKAGLTTLVAIVLFLALMVAIRFLDV